MVLLAKVKHKIKKHAGLKVNINRILYKNDIQGKFTPFLVKKSKRNTFTLNRPLNLINKKFY